jgi:hypothetical protein
MSNVKQNNQDTQFQAPFDVIPLPSKGLLYPGHQGSVKVEYMTATDENILTSPNLIKSGKVLDMNKIIGIEYCMSDYLRKKDSGTVIMSSLDDLIQTNKQLQTKIVYLATK